MVPTVFGVILVTFVLFNIVGGSPAASKLGKNVSALALEEFDEQRGYNKPLLCGLWSTTRAFEDTEFERHAGPWGSMLESGRFTHSLGSGGHLAIETPGEHAVPLGFELYPDEEFRWRLHDRLEAGTAALVVQRGDGTEERVELPAGTGVRAVTLGFATGRDTSELACALVVESGRLEMHSLKLRRKAGHFFDSQLWFYLKQVARLDFGTSHETNQRVTRMIAEGALPSLSLTVPMFVVGVILSVSLALLCAFFRNTLIDRFFVVLSVLLMSVNYLVWIVFGQYYLGYVLRWFPVWGYESWRHLPLPVLIGVVSGLGGSLRFYRTVMLDEMYRDYVRTAFAKGVGRRGVLFKHVLKNAMIPILTSVVMTIPFLYTGSLLLESFFGIPGLGTISINAVNSSDVDVIRAIVLVGAILYVIANLVTDICYKLVDPRVQLK